MRKMSAPNAEDMPKLKRLAGYLSGAVKIAQLSFGHDMPSEGIIVCASDFACYRRTRKPTTGGAALRGNSCLKTWSKTQATIALPSGEADLAAMVKGPTEAMDI